jgi:hypothetical protein
MIRVAASALAVAACLVVGCVVPPSTSVGPTGSAVSRASSTLPSLTPALPTGLPSPTRMSTPEPTPGPWRSASDSAVIAAVQLLQVVWTGQRFVATGSALGGAGAILDSTDGADWHRQTLDSADRWPDVLAAGPRGVVAIGRIGDPLASWASSDGLTWTVNESAFAATIDGNPVSVTAVVATDTGWLAVGRTDPVCNMSCGLDPIRALAWTSTDGLHWSRVADQASFAKSGMTDVTRGGPGFVGVGLAGDHAAVWTSPDGNVWTRVHDSPLFHRLPSEDPSEYFLMTAVAAGGGIVVAVGLEGPGRGHGTAGRAWRSVDGLTWTAAEAEDFTPAGETSVYPLDVIATPEGFLAIARADVGCGSQIWTSVDGSSWRCSAADPPLPAMASYAAATSGSIDVIVGLSIVDPPPDAGAPGAVWLRSRP